MRWVMTGTNTEEMRCAGRRLVLTIVGRFLSAECCWLGGPVVMNIVPLRQGDFQLLRSLGYKPTGEAQSGASCIFA